jgi:hypothetical protein
MQHKFRYSIVIACLSGVSLFIFFYPHYNKKDSLKKEYVLKLPDSSLLQNGDLIVRQGRGFISQAFLLFSKTDPRFSHAGFVSMENGKAYVYHAIGGEENKSNKLKKEALSSFCNPENSTEYGIFRYAFPVKTTSKIIPAAMQYYAAGLEFDTHMDLASDDKMYCSEFIYKILKDILPQKNIIPLSSISGKEYIAIDNLYLNKYCQAVFQYRYK